MDNTQKKPKKNIASRVAELVKEAVEDCGCTLWDVEFVKEGRDHNLIIYIDKEEGVTLDDCVMVNDAVNPIIDSADPIEGSYFLEISSPGIERELKTLEHIERFVGSEVSIKLFTAINGSKQLVGTLLGFDAGADTVTIKLENGESITVGRKDYSKMQLVCEF